MIFPANTDQKPAMRPLHLRLSKQVIDHLQTTAQEHHFKSIQALIRLYIRQGLSRDNPSYSLAEDTLFLAQLKKQGVSQALIDNAIKNSKG